MNCPNCEAPIGDLAKFCSQCGKPVPSTTSSDVGSRDLFDIPDEEAPGAVEDEFIIQEPPPPPIVEKEDAENNDFFEDIDEPAPESPSASAEPEDSPETKKVFSQEDDPTVGSESDQKFKDAKVDKKTLSKIRKRAAQKDKEYGLLKGFGYFLLHPFYCFPLTLMFLQSWNTPTPRWFLLVLLAPFLLWPILRTRGWNLRLSSHFTLMLASLLSSILVLKYHMDLSQLTPFQITLSGFELNWTFPACVLFFTLIGTQLVITSIFRSRAPLMILIPLVLVIFYGCMEMFQVLSGMNGFLSSGSGKDPITPYLAPYINNLSLYCSPHYLLANLIIPGILLYLPVLAMMELLKKRFSMAISQLSIAMGLLLLWLSLLIPFRTIAVEIRPHSFYELAAPVYELLRPILGFFV